MAAASNPFVGVKEASASGGAEGGGSTSTPKPDKDALVAAASNPFAVATEASASGGFEVGTSSPNRTIGASGASTERRVAENLYGEYASQTHEPHGEGLHVAVWGSARVLGMRTVLMAMRSCVTVFDKSRLLLSQVTQDDERVVIG